MSSPMVHHNRIHTLIQSGICEKPQKWAFFLFINWFSYAKTAQQTIQEVQAKEILNIVANDERIAQDKKEPTLEMGVVFLLEEGQRNHNRSPGNLKKGCTPLLF